MKITTNANDILRRVAKELVRKGMSIEEAEARTGIPRAEILREYEEPSPLFTAEGPDGTKHVERE